MDFITIPAILFIIFGTIYKVFDLFARRKERMAIIEKLSATGQLNVGQLDLSNSETNFMSLRISCLLLGLGLGLVAGVVFQEIYRLDWAQGGPVIGGSVLLFAGLAMIISFIVERKLSKKE